MKKLITIIALTGLSSHSFASDPVIKDQNKIMLNSSGDGEKCFDESTKIINIGFGFGGYAFNTFYSLPGYSAGSTPAMSLTYEQPWPKKLGPGYLGVGAYLGFKHEYENYNYANYYGAPNYYENRSWNYYMVAARAAYHWDVLNSKKAEVYAGVLIGLRIQTYTFTSNDPNPNDQYAGQASVAPAYSVFAGARWYFVKHVGLFGEVGFGISYFNGGVSIKF